MPSTSKKDRRSLDIQDIKFCHPDDLQASPCEIQGLLKLVVGVKDLKSDRFGGFENNYPTRDVPQTLSTRQKYEKELKRESIELHVACSEPQSQDYLEEAWTKALQSIVFHRFDRAQEEIIGRKRHHHCFICRKHYPLKSRPSINSKSYKVLDNVKDVFWNDRDSDFCELSSKEHFNLPNFCMIKLAYPIEDKKKKIPDATIGLHTYDLMEWQHEETIDNDRVAPFDTRLLQELDDNGYLTLPFELPKSTTRARELDLTFPFAIWEAKREGGGYDQQDASRQNANTVKRLLHFQDKVGKDSAISWTPLVWQFISVGPKWEIYGCYLEKTVKAADGHVYTLTKLWTGDSTNEDEALQLLYIVDIIALWGEHCYKPFAGACIQRLQAKLKDSIPQAEATLLAHQLVIDDKTFPWLFSERETPQRPLDHRRSQTDLRPRMLLTRKEAKRPRSQEKLRFQSRQDKYTIPDLSKLSLESSLNATIISESDSVLSLEPSSNSYILPERDCYIWLLNRAPKEADLLVIRINADGTICRPLLLFADSKWGNKQFESLVREEEGRKPKGISTDFTLSKAGTSYIRRCINSSPGYFRQSELQFCAIIPLASNKYERLLQSDGSEARIFRRLEARLGLSKLLEAAERSNGRICECQAIKNEYTPTIILCDNLNCPVGWYHNKCLNLLEDFVPKSHWLCKQCARNPKQIKLGNAEVIDANKGADEELVEASDFRIHRTKTFLKAWNAHKWPKEERISRWFRQIACRIEIDETDTYDTIAEVKGKGDKDSQCWAILKSNPKVMMPIESLVVGKLMK